MRYGGLHLGVSGLQDGQPRSTENLPISKLLRDLEIRRAPKRKSEQLLGSLETRQTLALVTSGQNAGPL